MATIREVAGHAGVSVATVSRALSNPDVVAPETLEQVMASVRALGYTLNTTAQSLRTARTGKILVTVPDIANPFFSQIIQGVEEAALAAGYAVLLGDTQHDPAREERYALMLRRKEADGLIFLGHRLPASLNDLLGDRRHPAPVVNGCEFNPELAVPSAHIDNHAAAFEAMAHLYDLGHHRIGLITGPMANPLNHARLDGARACARKRRAMRQLLVAHGDFSIASGAQAAEELLAMPKPPTALFCFSDEMAMGALDSARRLRVAVPRQLSVVGFDDIRFAAYTTPPLTTIGQPMRDIGRETVRLLLGILNGHAPVPASITLPHRLIVRESTMQSLAARTNRAAP